MATAGTKVTLNMIKLVSHQLVNHWKDVGRTLLDDEKSEINEADCVLDDIHKNYENEREKGYQMLKYWLEFKGENATAESLIEALRANNRNATATALQNMIHSPTPASQPAQKPIEKPAEKPAETLVLKPTLSNKEQTTLNFNRKKLVSRKIGGSWKDLAELLGYSASECDLFEEPRRGTDAHCGKMLNEWFKKKDNTFEVLAETLHNMGEETLAEKLRNDDFS